MFKAFATALVILASGPSHGPPDALFDDLRNAPSPVEAESVAADIQAGWMESGSPTVDLLMERAVSAHEGAKLERARALYDRAILLEPTYAEAYHRRAAVFLQGERYDEALRDLNAALSHEPRHFGAWSGLGMILERLGSTKEALEAYREALAIHPFLAPALRAEKRLSRVSDGTSL